MYKYIIKTAILPALSTYVDFHNNNYNNTLHAIENETVNDVEESALYMTDN